MFVNIQRSGLQPRLLMQYISPSTSLGGGGVEKIARYFRRLALYTYRYQVSEARKIFSTSPTFRLACKAIASEHALCTRIGPRKKHWCLASSPISCFRFRDCDSTMKKRNGMIAMQNYAMLCHAMLCYVVPLYIAPGSMAAKTRDAHPPRPEMGNGRGHSTPLP